MLPSIIGAAERDPEITRLHATMHAGNMRPFLGGLEAARRRGNLVPDRDPDTLVLSTVGPLFYRRRFSKDVIAEVFVARVIAQALPWNCCLTVFRVEPRKVRQHGSLIRTRSRLVPFRVLGSTGDAAFQGWP